MATKKLERLIEREEELTLEIEAMLKEAVAGMVAEKPREISKLAKRLESRAKRLQRLQNAVDRQKDLESEA